MATRRRRSQRSVPHFLARSLRESLRFDASALNPLSALRITIGIVAMLLVGIATSRPALGATLAVGALLAGSASMGSALGPGPPLGTMWATSLGMAAATVASSTTSNLVWVHLALLGAASLGAGLLVSLGSSGATVGVQAIVAFVVFGHYHEPVADAALLGLWVLLGGIAQVLLAVAIRWPTGVLRQLRASAAAFRELASFARSCNHSSSLPAAVALDEAAAAIGTAGVLGHGELELLRALVDVGRRTRIELIVLGSQWRQLARIDTRATAVLEDLDRLLQGASLALLGVADSLEGRPPRAHATEEEVRRVADALGRCHTEDPLVRATLESMGAHVEALSGQLRAAAALAADAGGTGAVRLSPLRPPPGPSVLTRRALAQLETLRANLTLHSTAFRHALRLCAAVVAATVLAEHAPLERGYWVPVTAAIVLRPDFAATYARGIARVLGTLVGVALASLIAVAVHPADVAALVVLAAFAWAAAATFQASYTLFCAFITGLVVLLVNLVTPGTLGTALARLLDTVVGGCVALVAYALWPTWSRSAALASLAALVESQRRYAAAVLGAAAGRARFDEVRIRELARSARLARSNAEAELERSLGEPPARRVEGTLGTSSLAALRRTASALHAVRTEIARGRSTHALPGAGPFAEAVDRSLASLAAVLAAVARGDAPPAVELGPLRRLHGELASANGVARATSGLIAATDELVDAIDTLGATLSRAFGAQNASRPTSPFWR